MLCWVTPTLVPLYTKRLFRHACEPADDDDSVLLSIRALYLYSNHLISGCLTCQKVVWSSPGAGTRQGFTGVWHGVAERRAETKRGGAGEEKSVSRGCGAGGAALKCALKCLSVKGTKVIRLFYLHLAKCRHHLFGDKANILIGIVFCTPWR